VPVLFLECRTSLAEVERRLRERERQGDSVSDANWEIALREQDDFPAFDHLPERCHMVIDTEGAIEDALTTVEDYLSSPP
jgi:predicted kinase